MTDRIERIKAILKASQKYISPRSKATPGHVLRGIGDIQACIALLSNEVEILHKMHLGLERANLELEELIKIVIDEPDEEDQKDTKDWKMKDPQWPDDYSEKLPDGDISNE